MNLLNGGVFSEEDFNIEDYTGGASYSSINVFTDHIYYVADDTKIVQVDRSSGESRVLYQVEAVISRMLWSMIKRLISFRMEMLTVMILRQKS